MWAIVVRNESRLELEVDYSIERLEGFRPKLFETEIQAHEYAISNGYDIQSFMPIYIDDAKAKNLPRVKVNLINQHYEQQ